MLPLLMLLTTFAGATTPSAAPPGAIATADPLAGLVDVLVAMPDNATREKKLQGMIGDGTLDVDGIGRVSTGLATLKALDAQHRADRTVVRLFLDASLSTDPSVRQLALDAAKTGGDPPIVAPLPHAPAASAATPGATSAAIATPAAATVSTNALDGYADVLMGLPDTAARTSALQAKSVDPKLTADEQERASTALAVVQALDAAGRRDRVVLKRFLDASLSPDADLRQRALKAATSGGDPPLTGSAPPPLGATTATVAPPAAESPPSASLAASAPPSLATLQSYKSRHLVRGSLMTVTIGVSRYGSSVSTLHTWTVYDGGGAPYRPGGFASLVGDHATIDRLRRQNTASAVGAVVLTAASGVCFGLTGYYAGEMEKAPIDSRQESAATAGMITTLTLGSAFLGGAIGWPLGMSVRHQYMWPYYTPQQADGWIDGYNASLRKELGLSADDTKDIDLATH